RARRNDEAPDALLGVRPDDRHLRDRREADPPFGARDDPVVAITPGEGGHAAGVAARRGFGEAEASDDLTGRHARQPLLLLLLAAPLVDGAHRERTLHAHEGADARIARLQLEGREPVLDRTATRASVALE